MASNRDRATEVFFYTGVEVVPKDVTHAKFASTVTEIGPDTFRGCSNLIAVELNEGLRVIGLYAFVRCLSLEIITLPSTVTEVDDFAFCHCRSLVAVVLNEGLLTIGRGAFLDCESLESITLPSTVIEVGDSAFAGCDKLREVVLSEGIQTIGMNAFQGCSSLESLLFSFILTRWDDICLEGQTAIENEINDMRGVAKSGGDILISVEAMGGGDNWETCRESLDRICGLIAYYELKEATAIIELSLWKAKIEEEGHQDREECRVSCGADMNIVMKGVLSFFSFEIPTFGNMA